KTLTVAHRDPLIRQHVSASAELIPDELNVKQVAVEADESAFITVSVKRNFKALGKRCGAKLKQIAAALNQWGFDEVARLDGGESLEVPGEPLSSSDVLLQRKAAAGTAVATDGHITVVLDTRLDQALEHEGLAREFISVVQNARKEAG